MRLAQRPPPNSPERARTLIFSYIEGSCNSEPLHSTTGNLTPNEFEKIKRDELSNSVQSTT
jgi:hypothetical protein